MAEVVAAQHAAATIQAGGGSSDALSAANDLTALMKGMVTQF